MKLTDIKRIITHDKCPDGTASAMILHAAFPKAEIEFLVYDTSKHLNLEVTEGMIFCDMTPPKERVREFQKAGAIVLDHHKYAKGIVEIFKENGIYADEETEPGVSGAVLALRILSKVGTVTEEIREFAYTAGIRDTWVTNSNKWQEACEQAYVLNLYPWSYWKNHNPWFEKHEFELGKILFAKNQATIKNIHDKRGFIDFSVNWTRVALFAETGKLISDFAESLKDKYDIIIGFFYVIDDHTMKVVYSLRSGGSFDVGGFALMNGGGGHSKAAGFSTHKIEHPIGLIADLILKYQRCQNEITERVIEG